MAVYNRTRSVEQLLEKTESSPPSFTVHLHPEFWILNNGSKFLYQNQIASLLDDIRGHRIPVDFLELFDLARVPFYDGCMVVELLDYRPQKSKEPPPKVPQKTRVVLHPNPETLWADICSLNQKHGSKWTDMNALEVEAKLLLATSPPLCLDPDPHLTRIVNHVLRVSTPSMPPSLKRKATAMEPEEDGPEKARRERLLAFMAPRDNKLHTPSYRILDTIANWKQRTSDSAPMPAVPSNQFMAARPQSTQPTPPHSQPPAAPPTPAPTVQAHSPTDSIDRKVQKQKKADTPQTSTSFNVAFTRTGSHTPIPPQPTHQFVNQHPPAHTTPAGTSAMQPQIYASFQAAQEAAKRSATPSQQLQMQHQQQMQMQQFMQYHLQNQQQLQQPQQPQQAQSQQQTQPTQNRPPSQPQQPQAQPPAAQQAQQRYTQSPKPPAPSAPAQSQASPQAYPPQFQPPLPTAHFLQQPPAGVRQPPKQHLANGVQQQGTVQPLHPTNASQAQQQLQQAMLYSQMQQSQQQIHQQQANLIMQQRMNVVPTQKNGGRATPQIQVQQNQGQAQTPQSVAASPSPARASPVVTNQQLAARGSPMPPKAQIPQQQLGGQQQQQIPQQHTLSAVAAQGMPHRIAFTPQYNPSQLRPTIQGTPTLAAASPRINARPITPAVGDVKPHQQPQAMQMQMQMQMQGQQPIRGPTPLQQQQQAQQQLQAQHMQNAAAAAQAQGQDAQGHAQAQQQVQQPAQGGNVHYPQLYGYQQFNGGYWRIPGMMPNGTQVTPQQQQLLQQQRLVQQQQQQQQQGLGVAQGMMATGQPQQGGQQFTSQQTAMMLHQQKLVSIQQQQQQQAVAAQQNMLMMSGGGGQPAQGMVMGKVHTQTPTQMQAMKGKVAPKKGVQAGKKTGAPQR